MPILDVYSYGVFLCEVTEERFPDEESIPSMMKVIRDKWAFMHSLINSCIQNHPDRRPILCPTYWVNSISFDHITRVNILFSLWPAHYYRSLVILLGIHDKHNLHAFVFEHLYSIVCILTLLYLKVLIMILNMYYVIILRNIHKNLELHAITDCFEHLYTIYVHEQSTNHISLIKQA